MIASLPMYDWPHCRAQNDALWAHLATALRQAGFDAPKRLSRPRDLHSHWKRPGLLLSQTCAMPFRLGLWRHVQVIGALDHGLAGCAPGQYRSALVVRKNDPRDSLSGFHGARAAVNARNSQSGYAALLRAAELARIKLGAFQLTGAHAASIRAVATGDAEIAAIDAVSWRMAQDVMGECRNLRLLAMTEPTPALPLICAKGADRDALAAVMVAAFSALPDALKERLKIAGFVARNSEDYTISPW